MSKKTDEFYDYDSADRSSCNMKSLKSIVVHLTIDDQEISGSFRAIVSSTGTDVLILGDKNSSIFFKLIDVKINRIVIRHVGQVFNFGLPNEDKTVSVVLTEGEKLLLEIYRPKTLQQAQSILTALYLEYKNPQSLIDTESFPVKTPYTIATLGKSASKSKSPVTLPISSVPAWRCGAYERPNSASVFKRDTEPKLHKSNNITTFLNKILEGCADGQKHNNRKQGYSGQLIYSD